MFYQELPPNTQGQDYFVGDLHGHYSLLLQALDSVQFNPRQDRLIATGDLINRGPESTKCLTLLDKPWFYTVKGNHEQMLELGLANPQGKDYAFWQKHGGKWWADLADTRAYQPYVEKLTNLPLVLKIGNLAVMHAEYFGDFNCLEQASIEQRQAMLWGRERYRLQDTSLITGIGLVAVGHTVNKGIAEVLGNTVYIDSGFWRSGTRPPYLYTRRDLFTLVKQEGN